MKPLIKNIPLIVFFYCLVQGIAFAQLSGDQNYVYLQNPRVEVRSVAELEALSWRNKDRAVTYYDGLGRPSQVIQFNKGGNAEHIIQHISYDAYGRQASEYLPYPRLGVNGYVEGAGTETYSYYTSQFGAMEVPVSKKIYDGSPLNRVIKQGAPGLAWHPYVNDGVYTRSGHTVDFNYELNLPGIVRKFTVNLSPNFLPTLQAQGFYEPNELSLVKTFDENYTTGLENITEAYTDKSGQTVLKRSFNEGQWHETYYVYDDFGNLSFVLPPGAASYATIDATVLNSLAFQYQYDGRNRLIAKKIPGSDWVYLAYDRWNRISHTQDGKQRAEDAGKYSFTKYDHLNRPVMTGVRILPPALSSIGSVRGSVDANPIRSEVRDIAGLFGYSSATYPISLTESEVYTVTYYDTYGFDYSNDAVFAFVNELGIQATEVLSSVKGQVTGSRIRVLGEDRWLRTVNYYDDEYRLIQQISDDPRGAGYIRTTNTYDFIGNLLESQNTYSAQDLIIKNSYTYDHANRLLKVEQMISEPAVLIEGVNLAINGNDVVKNGNGWNGGAVTTTKLAAYQDGFVSANVSGNTGRMLGLSRQNTDAFFSSIDYAIQTLSDGVISAWQYPNQLASYPQYEEGDELKIERRGSRIYYLRNEEVLASVNDAYTGELMGDMSLNHHGAALENIRFGTYTTLLENTYNDRGELIEKDLHVSLGENGERQLFQSIDYRYNIRGWLTSVNSSTLEEVPGININDYRPDFFGMEILYNDELSILSTQ